ncbi:hypothetical protein N8877_00280 [bacterium]|nr:hypothetical protein [bacterium]
MCFSQWLVWSYIGNTKLTEMKHFMTALVCLFAMNMSAQTYWPYNPDSDNDGMITVEDLMSVLSNFGSEWTMEADETEQYAVSLFEAGEHTRGKCTSECMKVNGRIPMATELMMWDSALLELPMNSPVSANENFEHTRITIWTFSDVDDMRRNSFNNSTCLYHNSENETSESIWYDWYLNGENALRPAYCFCIGAVPNPAFIPE